MSTEPATETTEEPAEDVLYCTVHPDVPTALRCNKCGRPMCIRCAVRTPVGYRCKQCIHQQQDIFFTSETKDYWIAGVVAFVLSAVLGGVLLAINFLLITLFLSAPAGGLISEAVHRATVRRRGRYTWIVVGLATVGGAVPVVLVWLAARASFTAVDLLGPLLYVALATTTAVARFRYGRAR